MTARRSGWNFRRLKSDTVRAAAGAPVERKIQGIAMGVRLLAVSLVLGALWDFFTTLHGVAYYFDLPMNPAINPGQFFFALAVTMVVFGFVLATHFIWNVKQDDIPMLILKAAWALCIAIDLVTSWEGTRHYVFYGDDGDPVRGLGLALVTALIVSSSIFLSRLILAKDV